MGADNAGRCNQWRDCFRARARHQRQRLLPVDSKVVVVIRKSGLPSSAVSVALLSLEMKRLIRQLPGKVFVKNR